MNISNQTEKIISHLTILLVVSIGVGSVLLKLIPSLSEYITDDFQLNYISVVLPLMIGFLIKSLGKIYNEIELLRLKFLTDSSTVFSSADECFRLLLESTENAEYVYTWMISEPPANLGAQADEYFQKIDKRMSKKKDSFKSFWRIASVHSEHKARWVLNMLNKYKDNDYFHLAIQYDENIYPRPSFHVTKNAERYCIFIWVTLDGGYGKGFRMESESAAKTLIEEHTRSFNDSIKLKNGRQLYFEKIKQLAEKHNLEQNGDYLDLKKFEDEVANT